MRKPCRYVVQIWCCERHFRCFSWSWRNFFSTVLPWISEDIIEWYEKSVHQRIEICSPNEEGVELQKGNLNLHQFSMCFPRTQRIYKIDSWAELSDYLYTVGHVWQIFQQPKASPTAKAVQVTWPVLPKKLWSLVARSWLMVRIPDEQIDWRFWRYEVFARKVLGELDVLQHHPNVLQVLVEKLWECMFLDGSLKSSKLMEWCIHKDVGELKEGHKRKRSSHIFFRSFSLPHNIMFQWIMGPFKSICYLLNTITVFFSSMLWEKEYIQKIRSSFCFLDFRSTILVVQFSKIPEGWVKQTPSKVTNRRLVFSPCVSILATSRSGAKLRRFR